MKNQTILNVENLYKSFNAGSIKKKSSVVVNGISFQINEGEILGLLGPNGAGKTTTIQMLLSTMTPTSGNITYFGKNFFTHRSEILQHVSFASTYVRLPGRLTVYQNLDFYGKIYGINSIDRKKRILKFLDFFRVSYLMNRHAGSLSAGETTRVILAKAFLTHPKIVLLDEPTASLDPDIANDIRHFILDQKKQFGTTMLFTSHNMAEVTHVCDRVLVLKKGNIIANSTPEQLAASISLSRVWLNITQGFDQAIDYAKQQNIQYKIDQQSVEFEIDEHKIADFLRELTMSGTQYSQISIDKPTLEDYFISVSKS